MAHLIQPKPAKYIEIMGKLVNDRGNCEPVETCAWCNGQPTITIFFKPQNCCSDQTEVVVMAHCNRKHKIEQVVSLTIPKDEREKAKQIAEMFIELKRIWNLANKVKHFPKYKGLTDV